MRGVSSVLNKVFKFAHPLIARTDITAIRQHQHFDFICSFLSSQLIHTLFLKPCALLFRDEAKFIAICGQEYLTHFAIFKELTALCG
jgi:hypothetical protein